MDCRPRYARARREAFSDSGVPLKLFSQPIAKKSTQPERGGARTGGMKQELTPDRLRALRAELTRQDSALAEACDPLLANPRVAFDVEQQWLSELDDALQGADTERAPAPFAALVRG